jgi:hypothetical protein
VLTIFVVALFVGGVAWWAVRAGDGEASPTTRDSATTSAPTITEPPTTTISQEDQFRQIAVDLLETRNDVFQNPAPGRVDEYMEPTADIYEAEVARINDLTAQGHHYNGPLNFVRGVRLETASRDGNSTVVIVAAVVEDAVVAVVDADGNVIEHTSGGRLRLLTATLFNGGGAGWRLVGVEVPDIPDDLRQTHTQGVLEVGLP